MLFKGSREFVPLYALYALLFADHGLTTAQISSLFALWSITSFVLEVPSGAWADTVSRRGLLVLSGALVAAAFTVWTAAPSYLGFALGFVLWGVAGALESGTFEALIYDDLAARERAGEYARVMGYARAAAEGAVVVAILAAAPLYAVGGYGGWSDGRAWQSRWPTRPSRAGCRACRRPDRSPRSTRHPSRWCPVTRRCPVNRAPPSTAWASGGYVPWPTRIRGRPRGRWLPAAPRRR
ncbi:MFS transporter [Nocardia farcinica]|uniref:MFS transporter n=1 Tax=Nocardia farcinica TaxID=37329 RepID=UPI003980464D